jgi:hypothetical protein
MLALGRRARQRRRDLDVECEERSNGTNPIMALGIGCLRPSSQWSLGDNVELERENSERQSNWRLFRSTSQYFGRSRLLSEYLRRVRGWPVWPVIKAWMEGSRLTGKSHKVPLVRGKLIVFNFHMRLGGVFCKIRWNTNMEEGKTRKAQYSNVWKAYIAHATVKHHTTVEGDMGQSRMYWKKRLSHLKV